MTTKRTTPLLHKPLTRSSAAEYLIFVPASGHGYVEAIYADGYDKLDAIRKRMSTEGIEFDVTTSWKRERLNWADGISLVIPMEVRNEIDLALVAALARRLILGHTTLKAEFPEYRYSKVDWLREQEKPEVTA